MVRKASGGRNAISSERSPIYPATMSTSGEGMFFRKLAIAAAIVRTTGFVREATMIGRKQPRVNAYFR